MTNAIEGNHALCPRCQTYEPLVFEHVIIEEIHATGDIGRFEGYEMRCRTCQFEITKIGQVGHTGGDGE